MIRWSRPTRPRMTTLESTRVRVGVLLRLSRGGATSRRMAASQGTHVGMWTIGSWSRRSSSLRLMGSLRRFTRRSRCMRRTCELLLTFWSILRMDSLMTICLPFYRSQVTHPLVSPLLNSSLGGLCPLYVLAGNHEVLRDEIVNLTHRAADPQRFPLREGLMKTPRQIENAKKYTQGTQVGSTASCAVAKALLIRRRNAQGTLPAVRRHVPRPDGVQLYQLGKLLWLWRDSGKALGRSETEPVTSLCLVVVPGQLCV